MKNQHLRRLSILLAIIALLGALSSLSRAQPAKITLEEKDGSIIVKTGESTPLATYIAVAGARPYLHPVYDASGRQILTEDKPDDHPWQHGIFTGFHRVNGFNYWKEDEGRQRLVRVMNVRRETEKVSWTALLELVSPKDEVVLEEEDTITVHAPRSTDSYSIDYEILLRTKDKEVQFGKFFVGGLSVRMPWDKENPRQTHLNSNGIRGRAGEQQRAAWCTVERPFGDEIFGIAILDHPRNPNHPPVWRVDEQGLINPNISGLADWSIRAGAECRFRYLILLYKGVAKKELLDSEFAFYEKTN